MLSGSQRKSNEIKAESTIKSSALLSRPSLSKPDELMCSETIDFAMILEWNRISNELFGFN
ncbi:MAG: hypothetical protein ACI9AT_000102 [Ulvibacter sp.]